MKTAMLRWLRLPPLGLARTVSLIVVLVVAVVAAEYTLGGATGGPVITHPVSHRLR
jgi:hypothetical protein